MKTTVSDFGMTKENVKAKRYKLENDNGMSVEVSDFGALVLSICVPDKFGNKRDVALGFEKLDDYYNTETAFGAYVGRNANRIANAKVVIDGVEYLLDNNDNGNNLHSGNNRSHIQSYDAILVNRKESCTVKLFRESPSMEQGFPGNLLQKIQYTLTNDNQFIIDYEITSDETTVINPTNHTYFNLNGHNSGDVLRHKLQVYSDKVLEINSSMIPTGKYVDVENTPMDFRKKKEIGRDIENGYYLLKLAGGYDHNYVFPNDGKLKKLARAYSYESGIAMGIYSDLCGLQLYTGNFLDNQKGKEDAIYKKRNGVCFETQYFPNACNEPKFPSSIFKKNKQYKSRTMYEFTVEK